MNLITAPETHFAGVLNHYAVSKIKMYFGWDETCKHGTLYFSYENF